MTHRPPSTPMETLGPCPPWCDGIHAEGGEQWGIAQFHETRPMTAELVVDDTRYEIATAVICQYPRAADPEGRQAHICMDLDLEGVEMGPEEIEHLAVALEDYLPKLRQLAARLVDIREQDPGDPTMKA